MKAFSVMRRLRERSEKLRAPLALLYLLLGMAAAWHAPHDVQVNTPLTIQSSSSPQPSVSSDAFCTLCSWQSLQQVGAATGPAVATARPLAETSNPPSVAAPSPGFSLAHLARGPPSV